MYLIDGYNLLYETDLETRDELVEKINRFCCFYHKNALIVFDGYSPEDFSTPRVAVRFVGDADHEIKQIMKAAGNPNQYVLVTMDQDLIYWARQSRIEVMKSNQFNFLIPKTESNETEDDPYFALNEEQAREEMRILGFKEKNTG